MSSSDTLLTPMMGAVRALLQSIGENVEREGLQRTPLRVAKAFQTALGGYGLTADDIVGPALFSEAGMKVGRGCGGGSGGIVVVGEVDSFALCESCFLPFKLRCHLAYVPSGEQVVGLSKLPRVVEAFSKRLQNPHKFAHQVVQALNDSFESLGVGVIMQSWHIKWPSVNSSTSTSIADSEQLLGFGSSWIESAAIFAGKGQFEDYQSLLWDEFREILHLNRPDFGAAWTPSEFKGSAKDHDHLPTTNASSCPFRSYDEHTNIIQRTEGTVDSDPAGQLATAVVSLLKAVRGFNPVTTEDLRCSAARFVNWLLSATSCGRISLPAVGIISNYSFLNEISFPCSEQSCEFPEPSLRKEGSLTHKSLGNGSYLTHNGLSNGSKLTRNGPLSAALQLSDKYVEGNGAKVNCSNIECGDHARVEPATTNGRKKGAKEHEIIYEKGIPFTSLCEHHLLPFFGVVNLGYISNQPIDKLALLKTVTMYSRRLQVQERLTRQIADAIVDMDEAAKKVQGICADPLQGVMVVVQASHMCMVSRGVEKLRSNTTTMAMIGQFSTDAAARLSFLKTIGATSPNKPKGNGYIGTESLSD